MSRTHQVYLVPGFFGFANLGQMIYFAHVREALTAACGERGLAVQVHAMRTLPTSSIRTRAARLLEVVASTGGEGDEPVHLVGHSTGGLDARLLATPGVSLPGAQDAESVAGRVRSVVTVCAPHQGTALAGFFSTLFGKQALKALSLVTIYALRFGSLPLSVLLRVGAALMRADDRLGLRNTVGDQVFDQLLGDFSPERRRDLRDFIEQMSQDRSLLAQLSPEGADMFNAGTADRPGVRYGSVVAAVVPQGLVATLRVGADPYRQATHAVFAALHRLAGRMRADTFPELTPDQAEALRRGLGELPGPRDNDGIVPALSQVWGAVIHACRADHLDVVGHFHAPHIRPPHYDWLASGSGFGRNQFDALWDDVGQFLADAARGEP